MKVPKKVAKAHNPKARGNAIETLRSQPKTEKILDSTFDESYAAVDNNNAVLLGERTKVVSKIKSLDVKQKKLSRKRRKELEKVLFRKRHKVDRSDLFAELRKYQATSSEMSALTSTKKIHGGVADCDSIQQSESVDRKRKIRSVGGGGGGKQKKILTLPPPDDSTDTSDYSTDEEEELVEIEEDENEKEKDEHSGEEKALVEAKVMVQTESEQETSLCEPTVADKQTEEKEDAKVEGHKFVVVEREEEMNEMRSKLPIINYEHEIVELIRENMVVVVCGETGSGKTTQVPQFLYEAGFCEGDRMIAVTEPRRVAAMAMSKRVAAELNLSTDIISYQIRYEGNATPQTKVKFMTDGLLLKEIQSDFLLTKYSCVLIDEAHERSVFTDVLLGLLSRIAILRSKKGDPLKLVIMSATLRVEDFLENNHLFPVKPPLIHIAARQFPVSINFNRETPEDYLKAAFSRVCKVHEKQPPGGILVFVSGADEVRLLCHWLLEARPMRSKFGDKNKVIQLPKMSLDDFNLQSTGERPPDDDNDDIGEAKASQLYVLPLYSLLPGWKQQLIFKQQQVSDSRRLVVVATNVAETSLTIPNIKYVVDTGKVKTRQFDKVSGASNFVVEWTSQASADQRSGRAGRLSAGTSYRLYSSAVYQHDFKEFSPPEILERPVDDIVLQMKSLGIDKIENFPFPTPPDEASIMAAHNLLIALGALDEKTKQVTDMGEAMASIPVAPRCARLFLSTCDHALLAYLLMIVSAMSVQEILTEGKQYQKLRQSWLSARGDDRLLGDAMILLRCVGAAHDVASARHEFCSTFGVREKALVEMLKLKKQLAEHIVALHPSFKVPHDLAPPTSKQCRQLRRLLLRGSIDRVAFKVEKAAYETMFLDAKAFIHPSSSLFSDLPEVIIFHDLVENSDGKLYMKQITSVRADWLTDISHFCRAAAASAGDEEAEPKLIDGRLKQKRVCYYGPRSWLLPATDLPMTPVDQKYYRYFVKCFLEGDLFPKLKKFRTHMLTTPSLMIRSWSSVQPKTIAILKRFISNQIDCVARLEEIWASDETCLLEEYKSWLPESLHAQISSLWPPL